MKNDLLNTLGAALRPDPIPLPSPKAAGELAAAAQPFARLLEARHADLPDNYPVAGLGLAVIVTLGDLRRLHAALAPFGGVR